MRPLDGYIKTQLDQHLNEIGELLKSDVLTILSAIRPGLDLLVRESIERLKDRKPQIVVILDTNGGIVEVVERMVETIRHYYDEVTVIVPDRAMSAGTNGWWSPKAMSPATSKPPSVVSATKRSGRAMPLTTSTRAPGSSGRGPSTVSSTARSKLTRSP